MIENLPRAEECQYISFIHCLGKFGAFGFFARQLATHAPDFAFQISNASFISVIADNFAQRRLGEFYFRRFQAAVFKLARDEKLCGNFEFIFFDIAREFDHFHAVQQWIGDGHIGIGGGNEHHVRKIVIEFQVMIREGVILFRVQHFEHR